MAHPKAVPMTLGGQTRHLVYDFNALCRLRDIGVDAFKLDESGMEDPRILRASLVHITTHTNNHTDDESTRQAPTLDIGGSSAVSLG